MLTKKDCLGASLGPTEGVTFRMLTHIAEALRAAAHASKSSSDAARKLSCFGL